MSATWGPVAPLGLLAATPYPAGFPLQNATPTILTWQVPSDGRQHRVFFQTVLHVTSATTGGAITLTFTAPDGGTPAVSIFPATQGAGFHPITNGPSYICQAGTTVTVAQSSAMTLGAAVLFGELWGS